MTNGLLNSAVILQLRQALLESIVFLHPDMIQDIKHLRMPIVTEDQYPVLENDQSYNEYSEKALAFRKSTYPHLRGRLKKEFYDSFDEYQREYIPAFRNQNHLSAEDLREKYKDAWQKRFEQAKFDKQLPENANSFELAEYFTTLIQGMTIKAKDGASKYSLDATVKLAMKVLK